MSSNEADSARSTVAEEWTEEDGSRGPGTEDVPDLSEDAEGGLEDDGNEETASPETGADPLQAARLEAEEWKETALRARADLDNYRKRIAQEKADAIRYANMALLENLMPVLDNFQLGLDAARSAADTEAVVMGMQMVEKQLHDFLADQNVKAVKAAPGDLFDPKIHDALFQEESVENAEGTIIKEIRKGYLSGERLLRPANVIVSKGPGPEGEPVS